MFTWVGGGTTGKKTPHTNYSHKLHTNTHKYLYFYGYMGNNIFFKKIGSYILRLVVVPLCIFFNFLIFNRFGIDTVPEVSAIQ